MPPPRKVHPNWDEMATLWQVSDELRVVVAPILSELDPPKHPGRPRVDARATLDADIFRLRSGCRWTPVARAATPTMARWHRTFPRWVRLRVRLGSLSAWGR